VSLEGEGAFAELALKIFPGLGAGRFVVFQYGFAIDLHGDFVALEDDVLRPPAWRAFSDPSEPRSQVSVLVSVLSFALLQVRGGVKQSPPGP
jgi:hypothetical protein